MTNAKVGRSLFVSIFVMATVPLITAFYLLEGTLETSLNLAFNAPVINALDEAARDLRALGKLDPQNRDRYRTQFEEIEALRQVYSNRALVKDGIEHSLKVYFGAGLVATLLLAIGIATILSRRIAASYRRAFDELAQQRAKVRYLEEMSSWQEMAKMLAHEIKNPLTPIEVLVTSLSKSFATKGIEEFRELLLQTERMIAEELAHLKNAVLKFSEFARLPQVALAEEDLRNVVAQHAGTLARALEADIVLADTGAEPVRVGLDATLFRQVMANILRNGMEANPDRRVRFAITLSAHDRTARVLIENDGVPVAPDLALRIFDPYISSKLGRQNMGLGLAIVKKIVIEHGGDIQYIESNNHPCFCICLPILGR